MSMVLSEKELQELHDVLLDAMVQFDVVCKENGIQYFLGGGTLLGAIRHGGFIPWDDDVDLMMTRADYDRLCSLPQEAFGPRLFLQTYQTDPEYHGDMAKIRLNGTTYATEFSSRFPQMHQGIFIDIFAHDPTARTRLGRKMHIFLTTLCRSMVFHKWEETPMQYYGKHKLACKVVTFFIRRVPMRFLEGLREWVYRMFSRSNSGLLYDGMGMHLSHGAFPAAWLKEAVEVPFEGYRLPVPKEYDKYLRYSYGDYMKIPAEHQRRLHFIRTLSLTQSFHGVKLDRESTESD